MMKINSIIQVRRHAQIELSTWTELIHQEMHRGKVHHQNQNLERVPTNHSCDKFL